MPWMLIDESEDVPLGSCLAIDGLFADLPERPRERFTLVGCAPEGELARAAGGDFLGSLHVSHGEQGFENLGDVVVRGRRPNPRYPGTVDIDLDGFAQVYERTDAIERPAGVTEFVIEDGGTCRDIVGLFRAPAAPPVPVVRLLGMRPEPALLAAIAAVGKPTRAAARRRRIRAEVHRVAAGGSAVRLVLGRVDGSVAGATPSAVGNGLLDVMVDSDPCEPLPAAVEGILDRWPPTGKNTWTGLDRNLRHHWSGVALAHHDGAHERPAGKTYGLDGRHVTDIEGFYCALGEAINGPGGYYGWNLDALHDCLCGGWGAQTPFTLVWSDAAVAREHLAEGYDRRRLGPAVTFDHLLAMLAGEGVTVIPEGL